MPLTAAEIGKAATALRGNVVLTPCLHSRTLSETTGAEVWLKFENLQFTGSFKDRGSLAKLLTLAPAECRGGVITASAGNHAQGVAYHAMRLGIPAIIVMPRHTPHIKVERTRAFGAEIVLHGDSFDEAHQHAEGLAVARQLAFVHAYDDEAVIAGQGTAALEMLSVQPALDILIVPVGGGGLISGMAIAAHDRNPRIRVVGVQCQRFPSMHDAIKGIPSRFGGNTIAEGIAVKSPGKLTVPIVRREVEDILLVDEGDIEQAIVMLLEIEKTVVEGAGAAALAALIKHRDRYRGLKVGMVLSGGNIDPLMLASIIQRGMVRSGRLARLSVELRDLPGELARVTACLAETNANIEEVHHQRAFTELPVQSAEVEFVLQTRGAEHIAEVLQALGAAGFKARVQRG
ncbi:MAG: threonine ammonia-lyase [Betaproteobacteria bacterium]